MYLDLTNEIKLFNQHIDYLFDEWEKSKIEHEKVFYLDRIAQNKIKLNMRQEWLETLKKMIVEEVMETIK